MIVSAIVAMNQASAIGVKGQIPWYLPADLKYFRKTTTPHHVIMGRQTFESIGKPLPNRINIILTRDPFYLSTGCLIAHSIREALDISADHGEKEAFIIGGAQIYQAALPLLDKLYITRVSLEVPEADAFFPTIDYKEWTLDSSVAFPADDKNKWPYCFEVYSRVSQLVS